MIQFRKLNADEIDVRVATVKDKGCALLLYKDARVDQNILDETFGIFGWQRRHELIGDRLYCTVSILDRETGTWISKQDVGTESYTEKEKGQASDSFKRACFNWGIGRELYTAPFIWVDAAHCTIKNAGGKYTTYDHFSVREIGYDNGTISSLVIVNDNRRGATAYTYGKTHRSLADGQNGAEANNTPSANQNASVDVTKKITGKQVATLKAICERHVMPENYICEKYGRTSIEDMTIGDWADFGKNGEEMLRQWDEGAKA